MPDSATLTVVFQDQGGPPPIGGAGGPPPSSSAAPTPAGGNAPTSLNLVPLTSTRLPGQAPQTGNGAPSNEIVDRLSDVISAINIIHELLEIWYERDEATRRKSAESPGAAPAAPTTPPPQLQPHLSALGKSLGIVATAIGVAGNFLNITTQYQNAITNAQAKALLDRNAIAEQAANTRETGQAVGSGLKGAGVAGVAVAGGLAATGVGLPVAGVVAAGSAVVGAVGYLAEAIGGGAASVKERFLELDRAMRQRTQQLAVYNPGLAGAVAGLDLQRIRAEMTEARFFGPGYKQLTERQAELDRLQRAAKAVDEGDQIKAQLAQTQEQINKLNADLNKRLRNVDKNTAAMVEELRKGRGDTPMDDFLKGLQIPDDNRPRGNQELIDARAQNEVARPLLWGQ